MCWKCLCCISEPDEEGHTQLNHKDDGPKIYEPNTVQSNILIAIYDFEPQIPEDLDFKRGDCINVEEVPELNYTLWALGFNQRTGKRGFVPLTYLAHQNSLDSFPWYFPEATETSANILLLNEGNENGSFLVRPKQSEKTPYILSVRYTKENEPAVAHYLIHYKNAQYFISENAEKPTLEMLIDMYYYKDQKNLLNLCQRLVAPCMQQKPLLYDLSGSMTTNWELSESQITFGRKLGEGNSGEIFLATYTSKQVVVKKLHHFDKSTFDREVENMKILRHKNIVSLYGVCKKVLPYYIILEYMDAGDLKNYVSKNTLTNDQNIYIISQILSGLSYLERKNIIHRDIAARNVLLDHNLTAKISDFGLSRVLNENLSSAHEYQMLSQTLLPIFWLAPECFQRTFSIKSDVWSFAITVIEIYTNGRVPFSEWGSLTQNDFKLRISSGNTMRRPEKLSQDIYKLLIKCWRIDPSERPSFKELWEYFNDLANRESAINPMK